MLSKNATRDGTCYGNVFEDLEKNFSTEVKMILRDRLMDFVENGQRQRIFTVCDNQFGKHSVRAVFSTSKRALRWIKNFGGLRESDFIIIEWIVDAYVEWPNRIYHRIPAELEAEAAYRKEEDRKLNEGEDCTLDELYTERDNDAVKRSKIARMDKLDVYQGRLSVEVAFQSPYGELTRYLKTVWELSASVADKVANYIIDSTIDASKRYPRRRIILPRTNWKHDLSFVSELLPVTAELPHLHKARLRAIDDIVEYAANLIWRINPHIVEEPVY